MTGYDAIVNPSVGKGTARIGPVAVMAACEPDVRQLSSRLGYSSTHAKSLMISRLYQDPKRTNLATLTGPMIGAPYAAMLLETLIVRGARKILFLGWCGALTPDLNIGDLVIPTCALVDEGTSAHYRTVESKSFPSPVIVATAVEALETEKIHAWQAPVWTTDAAFRETRERVSAYQRKGAVAVDMETSALFAVAAFRQVEIGAVLVVSDSLAGEQWQPGFRTAEFKSGRQTASQLVKNLCQEMSLQT